LTVIFACPGLDSLVTLKVPSWLFIGAVKDEELTKELPDVQAIVHAFNRFRDNPLILCTCGKYGLAPTINDVSTFPFGSISRLILGKRSRFYRRAHRTIVSRCQPFLAEFIWNASVSCGDYAELSICASAKR
jgi:hypothetical protein